MEAIYEKREEWRWCWQAAAHGSLMLSGLTKKLREAGDSRSAPWRDLDWVLVEAICLGVPPNRSKEWRCAHSISTRFFSLVDFALSTEGDWSRRRVVGREGWSPAVRTVRMPCFRRRGGRPADGRRSGARQRGLYAIRTSISLFFGFSGPCTTTAGVLVVRLWVSPLPLNRVRREERRPAGRQASSARFRADSIRQGQCVAELFQVLIASSAGSCISTSRS